MMFSGRAGLIATDTSAGEAASLGLTRTTRCGCEVWAEAVDACAACDLMLVVGTSAEVYPAAGLIDVARAAGAAIVIVNTEAGGAAGSADLELIGPAGEILPTITDG